MDEKWQGPSATSECMVLNTNGWGDDSHADTAIADHFSAYLLGGAADGSGLQPLHGAASTRARL